MAFDSEFKEELRNLSENEVHLPFGPFDLVTPTSGWYQGMTSESDGAAQSVRTNVQFNSDGTLTGHGEDADDGKYTLTGKWTTDEQGRPSKAKWTENYKNGPFGRFKVTVRATFLDDEREMECSFTSSEDVTGSFNLRVSH
mmetsp:Transcript_15509/g.27537  ORF Transcript_15509/g.27537 Transcript_15509/m.27537 type:complete len:141 (-) Transcript_15509:106-528(-)